MPLISTNERDGLNHKQKQEIKIIRFCRNVNLRTICFHKYNYGVVNIHTTTRNTQTTLQQHE